MNSIEEWNGKLGEQTRQELQGAELALEAELGGGRGNDGGPPLHHIGPLDDII